MGVRDTSRSGRRAARLATTGAAVLAVAVLAGCAAAPAYDGVLWLQMRDQQAAVMDLGGTAMRSVPRDGLLAALDEVAIVWDSQLPAPVLPTAEPVSVVYDVRDSGPDELGDPTIEFTEFVSSGSRPDVPRQDAGTDAGDYRGPSTVYTCYTWRVVCVADQVWEMRVRGYADGDDMTCDARLIERLPQDAVHIATADLLG